MRQSGEYRCVWRAGRRSPRAHGTHGVPNLIQKPTLDFAGRSGQVRWRSVAAEVASKVRDTGFKARSGARTAAGVWMDCFRLLLSQKCKFECHKVRKEEWRYIYCPGFYSRSVKCFIRSLSAWLCNPSLIPLPLTTCMLLLTIDTSSQRAVKR